MGFALNPLPSPKSREPHPVPALLSLQRGLFLCPNLNPYSLLLFLLLLLLLLLLLPLFFWFVIPVGNLLCLCLCLCLCFCFCFCLCLCLCLCRCRCFSGLSFRGAAERTCFLPFFLRIAQKIVCKNHAGHPHSAKRKP